jgi:hypothetical protein
MDDLGLLTNPYHCEVVSQLRRLDRASGQSFDRIAFALRAVELLRPRATTVIVYRSSRLHLQQGRDLRRGNDAKWVIVGVPADASAESIALAITEIEGVAPVPFVFDLALSAARDLELGS